MDELEIATVEPEPGKIVILQALRGTARNPPTTYLRYPVNNSTTITAPKT